MTSSFITLHTIFEKAEMLPLLFRLIAIIILFAFISEYASRSSDITPRRKP